ncbi:MAG: alpha/beta fold hydrolase [Patescibacteria group bacterium]
MFKKLLNIFFIISIYILFSKDVFAFQFEKSPNNPLPISYINNYANQLQANIFKEGDVYKGIFAINKPPETYYSLGYFESTNGVDWQMKKEVLNTGADLSNPSVLKTQTGYLLFLTRYENNIYRIYSSSCDFDFNCSSSLSQVIMPNTNNYSEKNGVFAGHPFIQDNRTFLFFGAWGGDGFKIKLAYSDDLITWQRCQYAFLYGGDGPFPYQENNELYLFFHQSDSTGIKIAKSTLPLSCNSVFEDQGYLLVKDKPYDQNHLIFPSVINEFGNLKLYYSGLGSDGSWKFNLALIPTPTLTPTPTSTPSPTPTVIPEKTSIIIIPGFLASWNREAIIHNVNQPQSNWKLNSIVKEYEGIINTLTNLGYEEGKNLFIFAYDWRKPVLEIVDDLNDFVLELSTNHYPLVTNYSIVGHSLGGLIGRIYSQKYSNSNIDKLITAGSPHRGATVAYKIVEAGEIERFNDYLWLTVKIISSLNKNNLETDKQTLNRLFPIMKDLFPIYNFLKKNAVEINISDMKIKNELLPYYNANLTNLTNLTTLVGEKGNTLKGFNIIDQTYLDKLLDNYPDGRPDSSFSEIGDYTVLSTSARINTPEILNLEHGELIYKRDAIKKILDRLDIQYNDPQIIEGKGTKIDSSLIFLIKSPAVIEVIFNGHVYPEQDGMIFIENAQSGDYQLKVKGIDKGSYEVIIGQIGQNSDVWDSIYGKTIALQTDDYTIHYISEAPKSYFETSSEIPALFNDLINYLKINNKNWLVVKKIELAKSLYQTKKKSWTYELFESIKHEIIKNKDFIALEKLENIEFKLFGTSYKKIKYYKIAKFKNEINKLKNPFDHVVLKEIIKRLEVVNKENIKKNEILIESISELLKVIKK